MQRLKYQRRLAKFRNHPDEVIKVRLVIKKIFSSYRHAFLFEQIRLCSLFVLNVHAIKFIAYGYSLSPMLDDLITP